MQKGLQHIQKHALSSGNKENIGKKLKWLPWDIRGQEEKHSQAFKIPSP